MRRIFLLILILSTVIIGVSSSDSYCYSLKECDGLILENRESGCSPRNFNYEGRWHPNMNMVVTRDCTYTATVIE